MVSEASSIRQESPNNKYIVNQRKCQIVVEVKIRHNDGRKRGKLKLIAKLALTRDLVSKQQLEQHLKNCFHTQKSEMMIATRVLKPLEDWKSISQVMWRRLSS
jgi:hypothetical protein